MTRTAGRPIPRRRTNVSKLERLLDLRDMIRNSRRPVPRWVYEEKRRLQQELGYTN